MANVHHGPGHGRKKKRSILRQLQHSSINALMPNTYSRRMTRYSAYDADAVTFRGDGIVDHETERIQEMEDKENLFLESLLTKIHEITSKFVLVNTESSDFPIVYVSDEFLNFWKYSRKQIFLKDGRLPMMVGESTGPEFMLDLEATMKEEVADHFDEYTLYKEGHKKTVSAYVSVMTLPKHSKARYVLVATEELNNADTFGVDLNTKKKSIMEKIFSPTTDNSMDINAEGYIPGLIRARNTIREDFEKEKSSMWLVIHDNSPKQIWDWVLLYTVLWTVFIIPMQIAFRAECSSGASKCSVKSKETATMAKGQLFEYEWMVSLACDVLFILDVLLSCFTTYINADGVVISEIPHILRHYLKTWFIVDVLAAIPWELIIWSWGVTDESMLHILKALAMIRLFRVFRHVQDYMASGIMSFAFMVFTFIIFAHWIACIWYVIGKRHITSMDGWLYKFVENSVAPHGLLGKLEPPFAKYAIVKQTYKGGLTQGEVYLTCLYFSFTSLSTVGFGNAAPEVLAEKVFSIFVMVGGALMYATIFGYVASIIHRMNQQASELNTRQTELVDFIKVHHFPESLSSRMEDFFYNYWFTTKGVRARDIMEGWPKALREDCYLYIHDMLLKRWPVLKDASIGCQRALSERLDRIIQCPGDTIYHAGDCVGEIYFVVRGHIKVIKNDRLIGILTSGDIFGENFWPTRTGRKSKANVQALTYCEFEVLTHENLNEILIQFPDYWDIWTTKLKISYELSAKGNLFSEDTPSEFVKFVENERTVATDEIVDKIKESCKVKDPKQYYYDLNQKRLTPEPTGSDSLDTETRKLLEKANSMLQNALERLPKKDLGKKDLGKKDLGEKDLGEKDLGKN